LHYNHEAEVKRFMDTARLADPEKLAVVCKKYPVKTQFEMDHIHRIELSVGLHPESRGGQSQVAAASEATYAELTLTEEIA
jgi:hypothetical protein